MKNRIIRILSHVFCWVNVWSLKELGKDNELLRTAYYEKLKKKGSYIGLEAKFKDIPTFPHDITGVFISGGVSVGTNCTIYQHVTIANNTLEGSKHIGAPTIGNNVLIGAGAILIGGIHIGNNCRIGAGAVVCVDIPDNSVVVSQPSRIIQK